LLACEPLTPRTVAMAEDEGLEAIRAKRLAELQAQYDGGQSDHQDHQKQQATKRREEDMKNSVLSQILEQGARARCKPHPLATPTITSSLLQ
jgi:programmed cell death protein 5